MKKEKKDIFAQLESVATYIDTVESDEVSSFGWETMHQYLSTIIAQGKMGMIEDTMRIYGILSRIVDRMQDHHDTRYHELGTLADLAFYKTIDHYVSKATIGGLSFRDHIVGYVFDANFSKDRMQEIIVTLYPFIDIGFLELEDSGYQFPKCKLTKAFNRYRTLYAKSHRNFYDHLNHPGFNIEVK